MLLSKIMGNISKKTAAQAANVSPEILALQKTVKSSLSQNLSELGNFAATQIPKTAAKQKELIGSLEKLAQSARAFK